MSASSDFLGAKGFTFFPLSLFLRDTHYSRRVSAVLSMRVSLMMRWPAAYCSTSVLYCSHVWPMRMRQSITLPCCRSSFALGGQQRLLTSHTRHRHFPSDMDDDPPFADVVPPPPRLPRRTLLIDEQAALKRVFSASGDTFEIPAELEVTCRLSPATTWIDITCTEEAEASPKRWGEALEKFLDLGLISVVDGTQQPRNPYVLPYASTVGSWNRLFLRIASAQRTPLGCHSIQDLTNRISLYIMRPSAKPVDGKQAKPPPKQSAVDGAGASEQEELHTEPVVIVTVHRGPLFLVHDMHKNWEDYASAAAPLSEFLYFVMKRVLGSYNHSLRRCLIDFDRYERGLFRKGVNRELLSRKIYDIKRCVAVYERCLSLTQDVYAHEIATLPASFKDKRYADLQNRLSAAEGLAKDINSDVESALQLIFQLSSFEVNELMRLLTLFSAFFIPLNFISSVYGMNVDYLPFAGDASQSSWLAAIFAATTVVLLTWFRRRKFI